MARDKGLPEDIYDAVVARLIDRVPLFCNESTCYQCLNPDLVPPKPGDLMFPVSPMSGQVAESYVEGGGNEQLTINGGLIVKIHSPLQLDQKYQDVHLLSDSSRGLWKIARKVIGVLSVWDPMKGDNELLRDPLGFLGYVLTKSRRRRPLGAIELHFKVMFDWDVTTPEDEV